MQTEVRARHSQLSDEDSRALISVFSAYTVTATLWLLFATGVGLLIAFKFGAPEFGPGAWLTFGRLRPIHTNATFYGFASIAGFRTRTLTRRTDRTAKDMYDEFADSPRKQRKYARDHGGEWRDE